MKFSMRVVFLKRKSEKIPLGNWYSSPGKGQYLKYVQVDPLTVIKRCRLGSISTHTETFNSRYLGMLHRQSCASLLCSWMQFPEMGMHLEQDWCVQKVREEIWKDSQFIASRKCIEISFHACLRHDQKLLLGLVQDNICG